MGAEIHLLAGLNGAGKTTYARGLAVRLPAVRFSLDEWVITLFGLRYDHPDHPDAARRCRDLIWAQAEQVLGVGVSVVLDWNLWSRERRAAATARAAALGVPCHLHHLVVGPDVAVARVESRDEPRSYDLDAAAVRHLAGLFEPPDPAEGGFELHEVGDHVLGEDGTDGRRDKL